MAALAGLAVLLVLVLAVRGRYEFAPGRVLGAAHAAPPAWTHPCWVLHPPRARKAFSAPCVRLRGTVLYVERHDPDGDGDRHLVVLAGTHLVEVKYRRSVRVGALPAIGATVRIVGRRLRPSSGLPVVAPTGPAR